MRTPRFLCREVVGRRVKLLRTLKTQGGAVFKRGRVMRCDGTYRGRFSLETLRRPEPVTHGVVTSVRNRITGVGRRTFEVLPPPENR